MSVSRPCTSTAFWAIVIALALVATSCRQIGADSVAFEAGAETPATSVVPTPEPPAPAVSPETVTPVPSQASPEPTSLATATPILPATPAPSPTATPTPAPTPTPVPIDPLGEALEMSSIDSTDCPADVVADGVSCSVARLPLDAMQPDPAEMIELMMARVDNGDPFAIGPVVYLQGGPGAGSVTRAKSFAGADHDALFVDQRGTGFSQPKLDCQEVDVLWERLRTNDSAQRVPDVSRALFGAYEACVERLRADGIAFDLFNTSTAAIDFELIRRLLGHETWSLWGISYGTRLGLTIMRDHPEGVRAAVLDSNVPFEVDFFATIPENALRAMTALDEACAQADCQEAHGDFLENLATLTRRLDEAPAVVSVTRPVSGATFPYRVSGTELLTMVFAQLYSTRSLTALPRQVGRADYGGLEEIVNRYVATRDPMRSDLAEGLYYATWCREELPFHDPSKDDDLLVEMEALFGPAAAEALGSEGTDEYCDEFAVSPSPLVDDQRFVSAIPTLVFAGAFDPITPPEWSRQVADAFANATYVELADHGHGMSTSCPRDLRRNFLANPRAQLDITCAKEIAAPTFE